VDDILKFKDLEDDPGESFLYEQPKNDTILAITILANVNKLENAVDKTSV